METRTPDENATKKKEAIYRKKVALKRYMTYGLYVALLLIVVKHFLKQYPIVDFAISIIIIAMLLALFYLVIINEFIKRR